MIIIALGQLLVQEVNGGGGSKVEVLTDENFTQKTNEGDWIVDFYAVGAYVSPCLTIALPYWGGDWSVIHSLAVCMYVSLLQPWCGHCKKLGEHRLSS